MHYTIKHTKHIFEGGIAGFAFASGLAALSTTLMLFHTGDHILLSDDVYGGTFKFVDRVF